MKSEAVVKMNGPDEEPSRSRCRLDQKPSADGLSGGGDNAGRWDIDDPAN